MNVKVITRHAPSNYGSLLQSIATIKAIEGFGGHAEIIDYRRKDERGVRKVWTEARRKSGNLLKQCLYTTIRYPIERLAEKRFDRMRVKYLNTTEICSTHIDLEKLKADVFMTGSDQVWGPMVNGTFDAAYFLSFVHTGKKVSYAASFGKTGFEQAIVYEYKKMLSLYDKVAVRENSAVTLLKSWGLDNCIGQVLDPTLLLTGDEWRKFFNFEKSTRRPYVLVYQLHNDPKLSAYAKDLASEMGMELVRVNPFFHQAYRGGHFVCCPDVSDFLSLIDGSSMMVTDSFHGTCFAINLNKQFVEVLPNNATGTRNQSILELTGLSCRIVTEFADFSMVHKNIDYNSVNDILAKERIRSKAIMKELLGL